MPKRQHAGTLKTEGPVFSKRASGKKNSEHKRVGIQYAAPACHDSHALRDLKQVSYPDLCSWGPRTARTYLFEHGVLSHEMPLCWGCGVRMVRLGGHRNVDDPVSCQHTNCYLHPSMTRPVEAYTPLHSQARQGQDPDYVNFLRTCFLIGVKVPPDTMKHLVQDVDRKRLTKWCQDIRLALASCEYMDSMKIEFEPGVLEFDHCQCQMYNAKLLHRKLLALAHLAKRWKTEVQRLCLAKARPFARDLRPGRIPWRFSVEDTFCSLCAMLQALAIAKKYAVLPLPPKIAAEGAEKLKG